MLFIELFVPKGALSAEVRQRMHERLVAELTETECAPPSVQEAAQGMTQVIIHEPDTWMVGKRPVESIPASSYLARVTVPAAWQQDMSDHVISAVTRAVASVDPHPERIEREPIVWVQVVGLPEGSYGTRGQALRSRDLVRMITGSWREADAGWASTVAATPGTMLDPVCGSMIPLAEADVTLEHDGETFAFCCAGCRQVFQEDPRAYAG